MDGRFPNVEEKFVRFVTRKVAHYLNGADEKDGIPQKKRRKAGILLLYAAQRNI